jgi:PTS system nitrogen regulatory IIA component
MAKELAKLIKKENITFLDSKDMKSSIEILVKQAKELNLINCENEFKEAVLEREEMVSTGIGMGVAIPHAKLDGIEDFFIIVGVNKLGIDWDAVDRKPVNAIFLIGGPANEQKKYLKLIAKLMLLVKNSDRREKLLNPDSEQEVVSLFQNF